MGREGDLRRKMVVRGGGIVGREGRGGKCNDNYRAEGCMPEFERERILQIIRYNGRKQTSSYSIIYIHPFPPPPLLSLTPKGHHIAPKSKKNKKK